MTPLDLYRQAQNLGLTVEADGADLIVIPGSKCPADFVRLLKEHKPLLLAWLSSPPSPGWQGVPPSDLPLVTLRPKPSPIDRERVIAYMLGQDCDRPAALTAWLVRRESAYYDGLGRNWDCALHAYAAARDAACWQLSRGEANVWELLAAFAEMARKDV